MCARRLGVRACQQIARICFYHISEHQPDKCQKSSLPAYRRAKNFPQVLDVHSTQIARLLPEDRVIRGKIQPHCTLRMSAKRSKSHPYRGSFVAALLMCCSWITPAPQVGAREDPGGSQGPKQWSRKQSMSLSLRSLMKIIDCFICCLFNLCMKGSVPVTQRG